MIRKPELIKGSEGHDAGHCIPCGFFFKGRCRTGLECEFCHLCTRVDVRRRNKHRKKEAGAAAAALNTNWETKYNQARVDALNASWPEKYDQAAVDALNASCPAIGADAAVDALNTSWATI